MAEGNMAGDGEFGREVGRKEEIKLKARREGERSAWFGLGMFGLVGWSVALPAIAFTLLGVWLDSVLPAGFSWTLTLLLAGVVVGCFNAWIWIRRELRNR